MDMKAFKYFTKFVKLFEGALIKPVELYEKFKDEYINNLVKQFSKEYSEVSPDYIRKIVIMNYTQRIYEELDFDIIIEAHKKALDKVLNSYYTEYLYKDISRMKKEVERETGRELTNEETSDFKKLLVVLVRENPMYVVNVYPKLYEVYRQEMYHILEKDLGIIAERADEYIKRENTFSILRNYLNDQQIKVLEELPLYYSIEIVKAIKNNSLDELYFKLQENLEYAKISLKKSSLDRYSNLLEIINDLKNNLEVKQSPGS